MASQIFILALPYLASSYNECKDCIQYYSIVLGLTSACSGIAEKSSANLIKRDVVPQAAPAFPLPKFKVFKKYLFLATVEADVALMGFSFNIQHYLKLFIIVSFSA